MRKMFVDFETYPSAILTHEWGGILFVNCPATISRFLVGGTKRTIWIYHIIDEFCAARPKNWLKILFILLLSFAARLIYIIYLRFTGYACTELSATRIAQIHPVENIVCASRVRIGRTVIYCRVRFRFSVRPDDRWNELGGTFSKTASLVGQDELLWKKKRKRRSARVRNNDRVTGGRTCIYTRTGNLCDNIARFRPKTASAAAAAAIR